MSDLRIGELFAGYSGLGMGVQAALGGEIAWFSEYDKAPSKILAHHYPNVPNHGDITKIDWASVEPVDILTGGSPCQDLSHAGKRQGMTEGTRSNLWVAMREAIAQLRPSLVVWENVRGAYSAAADSDLELCPRCVGDPRDRGPVLRALGRVLGDLSDLGYVGGWHGLFAGWHDSSRPHVGAAHKRFRVFVVAYADGGLNFGGVTRANLGTVAASDGGRPSGDGVASLLPTPTSSDTNGVGAHGDGGLDLRAAVSLMPTPRATDGTKGGPNQPGSSGDLMLPSAVTLLPTPTSADSKASGAHGYGDNEFCTLTDAAVRRPDNWGIYADAIARWEALTRPAPPPTQPSKKGTPQLSPAFSEWLMGLPEGHVTGVPGLSRNDMLKALGNGVCPQQCEAAVRFLLNIGAVAA